MTKLAETGWLTPKQVASLLRVSPITVRQWAQKGALPSEPTPGGHRRFSFEAVQCFAEQRGLQLTPVPIGKGELCNLLIVEDDEQLRDFLIELLAEYSDQLSVTTAATAFEAGRRVEALKPDLILLDLMLPGVDGVEICRELKAAPETQGIRIIAMTGYYTEENIARILSAGAEECLRKPLDIPRLLKICTQR